MHLEAFAMPSLSFTPFCLCRTRWQGLSPGLLESSAEAQAQRDARRRVVLLQTATTYRCHQHRGYSEQVTLQSRPCRAGQVSIARSRPCATTSIATTRGKPRRSKASNKASSKAGEMVGAQKEMPMESMVDG